jgi:hypothetical protein
MPFRAFLSASLMVLLTGLPMSAHARCSDMTVCRTDPSSGRKVCQTFHNVCSLVPLSMTEEAKPPPPGFSVNLKNLDQEQLQKVMDALGVDKSKVKTP